LAASQKKDRDAIAARRTSNGGDYWATSDGRWGVGAPYSTLDCGLMLCELGVVPTSPIAGGIAKVLFQCWVPDGRIRPGPGLPVQPCHTAHAARLLCRLGHADDRRLLQTFEWLLSHQHDDGGWRCSRVKLGVGADTDASNPGVTLCVLDAFRFADQAGRTASLDRAVDSILDHWSTRRPMGPCGFGIGSRFMEVEFPFARYNLFYYVYVLSFYERARRSPAFRAALEVLEGKLVDGAVVIEHQRPGLGDLEFCREGVASGPATARYAEIVQNLKR
jgi:hypothetical protein